MDFRAIIKAYPDAAYIDETVVRDKSGNVITIDQSLVDAAGGTNMVSSYENFTGQINFQYLDTAGGTSAIEYGVSIRNPSSTSRTAYINRATTDTDSSNHYRTASTITVMEIKV